MNNQIVTTGLVLSRTNFQEADRILTILSPDQGKVSVIAKGVRRSRSKLAGGIELFSISELTLLPSRGELHTLVSARMNRHFGNIVKDVQRTMLGYELLKRVHRATEDAAEPEYFDLLVQAMAGLDELGLDSDMVKLWFETKLLDISGHGMNLTTDTTGAPLRADATYGFDFDSMAFADSVVASFNANHIRLLRLVRDIETPLQLRQLSGAEASLPDALRLTTNVLKLTLRV